MVSLVGVRRQAAGPRHGLPVLVVHPLPVIGEAIAHLLREVRPRWRVQPIAPADLAGHLTTEPAPVVICTAPTTVMQERARAWVVLAAAWDDCALVGQGDAWQVVRPLNLGQVAIRVDELVAQPVSPDAWFPRN